MYVHRYSVSQTLQLCVCVCWILAPAINQSFKLYTDMAASLLATESGPASIPVEFVQTSCNQSAETAYHVTPSTPQKSATNVTIAYSTQPQPLQQGATAKTSNLNDSLQAGQSLHHNITQSIAAGITSQQHSVGASVISKINCIS